MAKHLPPWPHQLEAVDAVEQRWAEGKKNLIVQLPTGAGKSRTFTEVIERWVDPRVRRAEPWREEYSPRVLVIAHIRELIDQAAGTIRGIVPGLHVGKVMAGDNDFDAKVVVGSVQTLSREHRRSQLGDFGLIITDEAHHSRADTYGSIYNTWPEAKMLGVTATPQRADGKALDAIWEEIAYKKSILWMIKKGFLCDVRGLRVTVEDLDLTKVKRARGDFQEGELGEALQNSMAPEMVVRAIKEHAPDDPGVLFAPTIASASDFNDALNAAGISSVLVTGASLPEERTKAFADARAGRVQFICNVAVATEGTDVPTWRTCVLAGATQSQTKFIQQVGRVLRTFPGKTSALVLDVAGSTAMHSLQTLATLVGHEVAEGQTLLEAELEYLEEKERWETEERLRAAADAKLKASPVYLFGNSSYRWSQTTAGIWYVSTGLRYWIIISGKEPGTFDVAWVATKDKVDGEWGGFTSTDLPDLQLAMALAEDYAMDDGPDAATLAMRGRSWHREKPSEKQLALAYRMKIIVPDGARRLDVANLIDAKFASQAIDSRMVDWLKEDGREAPVPMRTAPVPT